MFKSSITNEEITELPRLRFEGEIYVIQEQRHVQQAVDDLNKSNCIGFDTESRPSFKKGKRYDVSLLQLSTEKNAYLFRLPALTNLSPIFDILNNPEKVKIGVAVSGDFKGLNKLEKFVPSNFIELQKYVKDFGIENIGLKKMTAIVLGKRLSKTQQLSNWELPKLSVAQKQYAALDAWASLMIYKKLKSSLK